ncbi:hypothetical protein EDD85DRAFT_813522 [Armillaria nabsnona]|nr:hypothetical protein EDD85DRAFT_813522 [Armillaria nabsnona]
MLSQACNREIWDPGRGMLVIKSARQLSLKVRFHEDMLRKFSDCHYFRVATSLMIYGEQILRESFGQPSSRHINKSPSSDRFPVKLQVRTTIFLVLRCYRSSTGLAPAPSRCASRLFSLKLLKLMHFFGQRCWSNDELRFFFVFMPSWLAMRLKLCTLIPLAFSCLGLRMKTRNSFWLISRAIVLTCRSFNFIGVHLNISSKTL